MPGSTGTAESHLLFLFCASARSSNSKLIQFALTVNLLSVALTQQMCNKGRKRDFTLKGATVPCKSIHDNTPSFFSRFVLFLPYVKLL